MVGEIKILLAKTFTRRLIHKLKPERQEEDARETGARKVKR